MILNYLKNSFLIGWLVIVMIIGHKLEAKKLTPQNKYKFSVCSVFKNEAPYLKEWIEYHKLIGVDHFYLYNDGSDDEFQKILNSYINDGLVTLINWPVSKFHELKGALWALSIQIPAYENAIKRYAAYETEWLVFLNVEEFIVPCISDSIISILDTYNGRAALTISSNCYDGADIQNVKPDLIIKSLARVKTPKPDPEREPVKTIFKPSLYAGFVWPSYECKFMKDQSPIRLSKSEIQINRYVNRSENSNYVDRLKEKLLVDSSLLSEELLSELFSEGYRLEDSEKVIGRFIPQLLEKMAYVRP